jgi:hypothetical protein
MFYLLLGAREKWQYLTENCLLGSDYKARNNTWLHVRHLHLHSYTGAVHLTIVNQEFHVPIKFVSFSQGNLSGDQERSYITTVTVWLLSLRLELKPAGFFHNKHNQEQRGDRRVYLKQGGEETWYNSLWVSKKSEKKLGRVGWVPGQDPRNRGTGNNNTSYWLPEQTSYHFRGTQ